jgi:hypothetical protein
MPSKIKTQHAHDEGWAAPWEGHRHYWADEPRRASAGSAARPKQGRPAGGRHTGEQFSCRMSAVMTGGISVSRGMLASGAQPHSQWVCPNGHSAAENLPQELVFVD